jgi:hypothetical protein
LLLIPKDYYFFGKIISDAHTSDISIAAVINPLVLILFVVLIVIQGFMIRKAGSEAGETPSIQYSLNRS